jgi:segregation and condensation protein A
MYKIRLPNFEGPFDLLLFFIKRDELNIYDIPIARITEEFLKYIRVMQYFDLELAGEFLLMASTLMYIKSQMLLPRPVSEDDEEIEDPRTQLVQRLLEYKKYKDAASDLSEMAEDQRYVFYRNIFEADKRLETNGNGASYKNATLFDLIKAFKTIIERSDLDNAQHVVNIFPVSVKEKYREILQLLKNHKRASFQDIITGRNKQHIVVSFLAILELIRDKMIFVTQNEAFDDIIISQKPELVYN